MILTKRELDERRERFVKAMGSCFPNWDTALITSKVNQYYFTGTMQDAVLLIFKGGEYAYFARQSHERAAEESPLTVRSMRSYRDIASAGFQKFGHTFIEGESIPYAMVERMRKYFDMESVCSLDAVIRDVRAVKTPYELYWIARSGAQHDKLLAEIVPGLLREGMSEADLVGETYLHAMRLGYQGISRFSKYLVEIGIGQFGFGTDSLYPTSFDGPGGSLGDSPAVPLAGNHKRLLKKGDLVFVDIGFGINGYHSDKTQVYLFGEKPSKELEKAHRMCMDIMDYAAECLKPGAIPAEIYRSALNKLDEAGRQNFMGYGARCVKFLGHGVGLVVDEAPVIAEGFGAPLQENMVISLEPKKGIPGAGMVGVEDTYVVTPEGGRCLTGGGRPIISV